MWEPLRAAGVGPGGRVAVAGLGGVGDVGVKFAVALGAEVTVLSRTADKADAARTLGASGLLVTTDEEQMKTAAGSFDFILDTISGPTTWHSSSGCSHSTARSVSSGSRSKPSAAHGTRLRASQAHLFINRRHKPN